MIKRMAIRNFKCLRDVQTGLERFTIFVGPNASGKSSILQAIDLLCQSFRTQESMLEPALAQSMSRGSKDGVELAVQCDENAYRYRARSPEVRNAAHSTPTGRQPSWAGDGRGISADFDANAWSHWKTPPDQSVPLPRSMLLRLESSKLIAPASAGNSTVMSPEGVGLHSALANMTLNDPDSWQELQADLRRIIPTIRRLRHTTAGTPALLFDTVGADSLQANQVSEGTLLVLGLLAAIHAPGRPNLLLLDDLDRGLHPKAQKELISLLRGLLKTTADLQLVATTHSPYMLDCMETTEVRMTLLRDDGSTVCAALAEHPEFQKWKDEMTPGEMWSLFGEKWLLEKEGAAA